MKTASLKQLALLALTLALPTALFAADYSYQETTQITGGSVMGMMKMAGAFSSQARKAGDPVVTSVYLKDNRLANVSPDRVEIIDLDAETITSIDNTKHTYTVMTFQQMKDQIAKAQQEMQQKMAQQPAAAAPPPDANNVKVSFDVKVRNTGTQKEISGLSANEAIMTVMMNATDQTSQQTGSMAITNDMWMVPEIPGYEKLRDFHIRMAEKMGMMNGAGAFDMSKLLAQNPGATDAMSAMVKEMQKLKGVPISQIMRMGTTLNGQPLPAASEAPLPPDNTPAMPSGKDIAKQSAASAITSHLGPLSGFGGFGKKKDPPPPDPSTAAPPPTFAILMESQTTTTNFSDASVDPVHFQVPSGYKLVQWQTDKQ